MVPNFKKLLTDKHLFVISKFNLRARTTKMEVKILQFSFRATNFTSTLVYIHLQISPQSSDGW